MENIFDGIQRPLEAIAKVSGDCFIPRGINVPSLDVVKQWEFRPSDKFKVPTHFSACMQTALLARDQAIGNPKYVCHYTFGPVGGREHHSRRRLRHCHRELTDGPQDHAASQRPR